MGLLEYVFILFGVIILIGDIYFGYLSFLLHFGKHGTCTGYLQTTQREKNKIVRRRIYKDYLNYSYVYRVNGIAYTRSGGTPGKGNILPRTVTIIYVSKKPELAYIKNLTTPTQTIIFFMLLPLTLLWFAAVFGVLLN